MAVRVHSCSPSGCLHARAASALPERAHIFSFCCSLAMSANNSQTLFTEADGSSFGSVPDVAAGPP